MSAGFTPGPWSKHPFSEVQDRKVVTATDGDSREAAGVTFGAGNTIIGEVRMQTCAKGHPVVSDENEMRANAALCIAAPRLYEALEFAASLLEDAEKDTNWCCGDPYSDAGPIKDFRALLAEARGEA